MATASSPTQAQVSSYHSRTQVVTYIYIYLCSSASSPILHAKKVFFSFCFHSKQEDEYVYALRSLRARVHFRMLILISLCIFSFKKFVFHVIAASSSFP